MFANFASTVRLSATSSWQKQEATFDRFILWMCSLLRDGNAEAEAGNTLGAEDLEALSPLFTTDKSSSTAAVSTLSSAKCIAWAKKADAIAEADQIADAATRDGQGGGARVDLHTRSGYIGTRRSCISALQAALRAYAKHCRSLLISQQVRTREAEEEDRRRELDLHVRAQEELDEQNLDGRADDDGGANVNSTVAAVVAVQDVTIEEGDKGDVGDTKDNVETDAGKETVETTTTTKEEKEEEEEEEEKEEGKNKEDANEPSRNSLRGSSVSMHARLKSDFSEDLAEDRAELARIIAECKRTNKKVCVCFAIARALSAPPSSTHRYLSLRRSGPVL